MEELLEFFREHKVSIQITVEPHVNPTVHAIFKYNGDEVHVSTGETVAEALQAMKNKYIEAMGKWIL